jgi:ATP/maltotriose-dependent transcriptional regulator MalT
VTSTSVTLVQAPASTGKTTLVRAWAHRAAALDPELVVHWLTRSQHESLPACLRAASGDGAHTADQGSPLAQLVGSRSPRPSPRHVLVADDAHLLPQASIDLLSSRLEEDPGSLRLVVMTRQQIGLPLVVLRLHGSAQHLTHADLAFDHRETAELVGLIAPDLTPDAVYRLDELTRGWAGPLVMSARAEAAAGRGGATHTAMLLGTDFLEHLLADEWDALPPAVRHTLLATCQESDTGPVAAALLTGDLAATAHLAELAASGTLVGSTVMADGPAWRVHPLLRELMRRWTAPGGAHVDVVVAAHARAARGYAARNDPAPALRHARLSGEPALVVDVLTEYGPSLLCAARTDEVSEAFVALPATVCEQPHVLAIDALLRRANGDVNGAARTAARAAANAVGVEADLALRADLALLGVWQGRYGWTDVRAAIRTASDILGCHHGDESHHALQGLSLVRSA